MLTLMDRGSYLVNAIMGCEGCHTPRPGGVFDMSKRFSGGSQVWDEKAYTVRGSNITSDPETGIEADIKRALTEGVRPNGVPIAPQMPFAFYKILTPRDLDAVATYVKSVAPVRNQVPPPVYKAAMHAELMAEKQDRKEERRARRHKSSGNAHAAGFARPRLPPLSATSVALATFPPPLHPPKVSFNLCNPRAHCLGGTDRCFR
jgi:mono/diheme cytochrome c family protein